MGQWVGLNFSFVTSEWPCIRDCHSTPLKWAPLRDIEKERDRERKKQEIYIPLSGTRETPNYKSKAKDQTFLDSWCGTILLFRQRWVVCVFCQFVWSKSNQDTTWVLFDTITFRTHLHKLTLFTQHLHGNCDYWVTQSLRFLAKRVQLTGSSQRSFTHSKSIRVLPRALTLAVFFHSLHLSVNKHGCCYQPGHDVAAWLMRLGPTHSLTAKQL